AGRPAVGRVRPGGEPAARAEGAAGLPARRGWARAQGGGRRDTVTDLGATGDRGDCATWPGRAAPRCISISRYLDPTRPPILFDLEMEQTISRLSLLCLPISRVPGRRAPRGAPPNHRWLPHPSAASTAGVAPARAAPHATAGCLGTAPPRA